MMCSTTSNCSTIPNDAMVTMETCHQWVTKETILRSSQVSRELGAVQMRFKLLFSQDIIAEFSMATNLYRLDIEA
jgi:hypothetical protein